MGYQTVLELSADKIVDLGGENGPTSVEGYYLGFKEVDGDYGPSRLHIFQTEEGNVGVFGKTHSNSLLTESRKGQMVRLSFTGMRAARKKGRKPSYTYKLEFDASNTIDLSAMADSVVSDEPEETSYRAAGSRSIGRRMKEDEADAVDSDEQEAYESTPVRPAKAPTRPLSTPSPEQQAKVRAQLMGTRKQ